MKPPFSPKVRQQVGAKPLSANGEVREKESISNFISFSVEGYSDG